MLNTNLDALGIIFPNSYDNQIPELCSERLMASIPFASRYRMIDFILSGMVNCGVDNVSVIVRKNYRSLLRHIGSGREWDLTRKNGGLNVVPPYAEKGVSVYNGRIEALASIIDFLKKQKEKYVIISDANIVSNFDYNALLAAHKETGADVTIVYKEEPIPYSFKNFQNSLTKDMYYTLDLEGTRVKELHTNAKEDGLQNLSMNIYFVERELLIKLVEEAHSRGYVYFERDILSLKMEKLAIHGYKYEGYTARITDLMSYYTENMRLLEDDNMEQLFGTHRVYTKVRDDNPTRYLGRANVKNTLVADGCVIEGKVENCILFRGVKIGKGAVVKNSIIMQDTEIMTNAEVNYVITDKEVTITAGKELKGNDSFPVFIPPYKTV